MEFEGGLQLRIEKIIRSRIYETGYWKEECFGLNAETIIDKAVSLSHIGGQFGNQKPTNFLCLVLKLLQIDPENEIVLEYIEDADFKYLRALGAFYLRLTASPVEIYTHLEPLLTDYRKLRWKDASGALHLTHVDEFVDDLLTKERVCDVILPRLPKRHVLEELGDLEPRVSPMMDAFEAELDEKMEAESDDGAEGGSDAAAEDGEAASAPAEPAITDLPEKIKISEKKVSKLFKSASKKQKSGKPEADKPQDVPQKEEFRESMSIEETNRMRISLGLKPLKP